MPSKEASALASHVLLICVSTPYSELTAQFPSYEVVVDMHVVVLITKEGRTGVGCGEGGGGGLGGGGSPMQHVVAA